MISLFLAVTEAQMTESGILFTGAMDRMWQNQHILPIGERFTSDMTDVLDRQLALITTRLDFVYRCKMQQLAFQSPAAPS